MTVLNQIIQFIISLGIIVIVHEFGHFLFAKLFKTRVEKFYLFFDPWFSLFKFKRGETEYGIGWLPLGGYVKISGMIDESMDKEQMKLPPKPYEFRSKPAWQRLLIMVGGVVFNFILAMVLYVMVLFTWGETYLPTENVKYGIVCDATALEMGLRNGDKILTVDGQKVESFYEIVSDILLNDRKNIQVNRDGRIVDIEVKREHIAAIIKNRGRLIDARMPFMPFEVADFQKLSPAKEAGIQLGDILTGIDGKEFKFNDEYIHYLGDKKEKRIIANLMRDNEEINIELVTTELGMLGIIREAPNFIELRTIKYGFIESIPAGVSKGITSMKDYLKQFKLIFSRDTKAYESLGGFITIGSIFPGVWDWQAFWTLTAFLSIILAIMNMLPIPALDGGHVLFLIFELVSGRKPSDKFLEYAQMAGMLLLVALLIFANGNDIVRLLRK